MRAMARRSGDEPAREPELWVCRPEAHRDLELEGGVTWSARDRHVHDAYELGTVLQGSGRVWIGGREHRLQAGDVYLVAPGEVHRTAPDAEGWSFELAQVTPAALVPSGEGAAEPRSGSLADPLLSCAVRRMFELLDACEPSLEADEALVEAFSRTSAVAARAAPARPASLHRRAVERAREYLQAHSTEPVRLEALSRQVGLSPFQLLRGFQRRYGAPPHALQTALRVERARALLRDGRGIAEIALATGFADQSHLGRSFKRALGLTPGQYQAWLGRGRGGRRATAA